MKSSVVLIHGGVPELVRAVSQVLLARGATVALYNPQFMQANQQLVAEMTGAGGVIFDLSLADSARGEIEPALSTLHERYGTVDAVVNLYVPTVDTDADALMSHPRELERLIVCSAGFMAEKGIQGIVVNQSMLASIFADHPLAFAAAAARGAVTGIIRTACIRFGKTGVRVGGVFVGLLDLPDIKAVVAERVLTTTPPLGRWITVKDVAESVSFLALDSGYMSGQMLVLDGGMTSGTTGI